MKFLGLPGSSADVPGRASRFSRNAGATSIRFATVLGCLFAFVLLCMISMRANATPLFDDLRPAAARPSHDAMGQLSGSACTARLFAETGASASSAYAGDEGCAAGGPSGRNIRAATADEWQTWLWAIAAPAIVALGNACLFRGVPTSTAETPHRTDNEWSRGPDSTETVERASRLAASAEAGAALSLEPVRLSGAMSRFVEAPVIAVMGMIESIETVSMLPTQRTQLAVVESALRTWSQTLHDLLDASPVQSRSIVLDESVTNLRNLMHGAVALLSTGAAQRGVRVKVTVDPTVATTILVDRARLGQMVFHMLSRAIQIGVHQEIAVDVRSEPLNAGSQRIFISVKDIGLGTARTAQLQLFESSANEPFADQWPGGTDTGMALCRTIAQRMQGELLISSGSDCVIHASFSAPFAVEQWESVSERVRNTQLPSGVVAHLQEASPAFPSEPFERRYLEALSDEGIDLRTFLAGWRNSIDDDLARLNDVSQQHHSDGLYSVLHRLSGAVGLVGAHSLMEALQRASAAPMEHDADAIDTLAERTRILAMQLDVAIDPHGSVVR
ncbi:Sensor histidine kinase RcsC [Paraburkholderia sediminicola]|uniref:histidine kinase n=1 Tax=Paraburkholderia sediminicola TaxID=458836 RepID=A0A6J5A8A9_9BURK|nr:HAMP domain-containing sensor histidine kinase [Paraburkholderia sediminicola]CAB3657514.1 Sensor histidine kinase RcsC [Paraburkholderia sediminicola]